MAYWRESFRKFLDKPVIGSEECFNLKCLFLSELSKIPYESAPTLQEYSVLIAQDMLQKLFESYINTAVSDFARDGVRNRWENDCSSTNNIGFRM